MSTQFEIAFTINGHQFTLGQIPHGEDEGKWVWSTKADESVPFAEAWEAQQNAILYARAFETAAEEDRQEQAEIARYGSYEQQHWHDGRA